MTTDCRFASLVAFSQSRAMGLSSNATGAATVASPQDCGRGEGGKFGQGNKCAGDGSKTAKKPMPEEVVASLRDGGKQTPIAKQMYAFGLSERKLASMIEKVGGSPSNSTASTSLGRIHISVKDKQGNEKYFIEFRRSGARVYPSQPLDENSAKEIESVAKSSFPEKGHKKPFAVQVFQDPSEIKKWEKEEDDRYKKAEDKYKFTLYLPPHERPKQRAMYASLVAFHQSRNCGTGSGGFQKGNTCAGGVVADVAKGAIKGAASGAIMAAGSLAPTPQYVAAGAGVGAAAGAVKGLYDNRRRPTRVLKTIERIGSSEEKVSSLVKKLGGTPKSSADVSGKKLVLTVRNKGNKKSFTVEMDDNEIVVYPRQKADPLTSSEISRVQEIAKEASGKTVSVVVKSSSKSYTAKLVRKGFKVAANAAGELIASIVVPPAADVVIGDLAYAAKKVRGR